MSIEPYSVEELAREVRQMPSATPLDWIAFVPLGARLGALGEVDPLEEWRQRLRRAGGDLNDLIETRAELGVQELGSASDEHLGHAVIDAQDFACFLAKERDILPERSRRWLEYWVEWAEDTPLDDEAVEVLGLFRDRFPIRRDLLLNVVASPLSDTAEAVLALSSERGELIEKVWPRVGADPKGREELATLQVLDSGRAPQRLQQLFERLGTVVDCGPVGPVRLTRRLLDNWTVEVLVKPPAGASAVVGVRLGPHAGRPAGQNYYGADRWLVRLAALRAARRPDDVWPVLWGPLSIRFADGTTLRLVD